MKLIMIMQVGDMVKWATFDDYAPDYVKRDIGIIVGVEIWDRATPVQTIIEVYFFRSGHQWCNPNSLEIVSTCAAVYGES